MPLPPSNAPRALSHTRELRLQAYKREDGLWDLEGHLFDWKPFDYELSSGVKPAGTAVHEMSVRLTVDADLNVIDAVASTDGMPYAGACDAAAPEYARLVGLNLANGFRQAVNERFGGTEGCRHINELLAQFPTIAIQGQAGEKRDNDDSAGRPFYLDQCRALDTRGEVVRKHFVKWFRGTGAQTDPRR